MKNRPLWQLQLAAICIVTAATLVLAAFLLTKDEVRNTGANAVSLVGPVAKLKPSQQLCLAQLELPQGSTAIRIFTESGPKNGALLQIDLIKDGRRLSRKKSMATSDGSSLTATINEIRRSTSWTKGSICIKNLSDGSLNLIGENSQLSSQTMTVQGKPGVGEIRVEFTSRGKKSLISLVPEIFHRASLFKAGWIGPWVFYLLPLLWLTMFVGASFVLIRNSFSSQLSDSKAGMSVRRTALIIGAIALVNGVTWATVMPSFQQPDEPAHFSYVQLVGQHVKLPENKPGNGPHTNEAQVAIDSARTFKIAARPTGQPLWTEDSETAWLEQTNALGDDRYKGGGYPGGAASYPPLYYTVAAGAYRIDPGGSVFSKVWLVRVFSALLGALTAIFTFLFAREFIRSRQWLPVAAGLFVALHPLFISISGSVNNDSLMVMLATVVLYLVARAFNRGINPRLAAAIGFVLALGLITKQTIFGIAPAVAIAVLYLALKGSKNRSEALKVLTASLVALLLPVIAWYATNYLIDRPLSGFSTSTAGQPFTITGFLSYVWQWYLPPLTFMGKYFAHDLSIFYSAPAFDVWVRGFWGGFGWLDTNFPTYVYNALQLLTASVAMLLIYAAITFWKTLKENLAQVLFCVLAVIGQVMLVHLASYIALIQNGTAFAQGRYLFPVIAIFALAATVSLTVFGRRMAPIAAVTLITAMIAFNAISMGLALTRYYV